MTGTNADLLATIVAATRRIVEVRERQESRAAMEKRALARPPRPGHFTAALTPRDRVHIIAECKRRSPLRGVLRASFDPPAIAAGYVEAGAAAISVLTEPTFFDGSLGHLEAVRRTVDAPVLRKDFIISEYQLLEARAAGADAVLLIVAALPAVALRRLHDAAAELGLDTLVEVHDAGELEIAAGVGAKVVGVNNRDLRTQEVSVRASVELIPRMPAGVIAVSESGLKTPDDVRRLRQSGYQAFLIGERFMTSEDPGRALRELISLSSGREAVP